MSPETGSMSSLSPAAPGCHSLITPLSLGHSPFMGLGGPPSPPVLLDIMVRADVPWGAEGVHGTPGSSTPHPSGSIPAGITCVPCRGAAFPGSPTPSPTASRLLPQPPGCTAEPPPAPVPCCWKGERRTSTEPCYWLNGAACALAKGGE